MLAALLVAAGGLDTAFAAAGAACALAAGLAWMVPAPVRAAAPAPGGRLPLARAGESGAPAQRIAPPGHWVRLRIGLFGASALVQSMLELLLVVTALDLLAMGSDGVGWLRAAFAVGGLAGGAAAVALLRRGRLAIGLAAGLTLAGIPLALVPAWPQTAPVLVFLALLGGGYALLDAALLLLTQRLAPAATLARMAALEELVYPLARAAGTGLAAWIVVQFGGSVDLREDGGPPERLGAGDSFGAAALLRDDEPHPPAAALTEVSALTIARSDFLRRVTPPARRAARRAPERRSP
ncbi:MAG: Transrane secretion effector [Thermoleophilaceae bacterium]|nr:Transrane secretion effector [Thermoleophilaceae bacterium]